MKFSAVLQDSSAVDTFLRILSATSKLGKKRCCMKLQTDAINFISCANLHDGGSWFSLTIPCSSQLFRRFDMVGMNPRQPEQNYIFFELDIDILVRILPGGHCWLKLKLSKSAKDEPILAIEVRNTDSDIVSHQVPVTIILSKYWNAYARPSIGHQKMSIFLPTPKVIYRVVSAYRNMNAKIIKFTAISTGDLRMTSNIEHGEVDTRFTDLQTNITETDSQEEVASVQLMIKSISTMFQSFIFSRSRVKMSESFYSSFLKYYWFSNIINHRMAEFNINSEDCTLSYIVGNVSE